MNHIFKTKFNITTGVTKVVSEIASNRRVLSSKKSNRSGLTCNVLPPLSFKPALIALSILSYFFAPHVAYAAPIHVDGGSIASDWGHNKKCDYYGWFSNNRDNSYCQFIALNPSGTQGVVNFSVMGVKAVAIGNDAKARGSQSVTVGNNSAAHNQSVAIGADVFARGKSSVAIGNDDIDDSNFYDKLPESTINTIYRELWNNGSGQYFIDERSFKNKYNITNGQDNRQFSPTYAGGLGSIAIGSRTVASGKLSTSLGALSFALADYSTTLGMRAFVSRDAQGGTAIGRESRVFAEGSLAIGNFNESTNKGAMSYGSNAKAVGENTIAIGSMVAAGAKFNADKGNKWLELYKNFNKNETVLDDASEFDTKASEILKNGTTTESMPLDTESEILLTIGRKEIKKTQKHGETGDGKNAIVIGGRSFALWQNSLALGYSALADASNAFAIGSYAYAGNRADNAMAIGVRSYAEGKNSIALGYRARVQDESQNSTFLNSISNGKNKDHYKGNNSLALGIESLAYLNNSVALGHQSETDYLYSDLLAKPYTPKGSIIIPTSGQTGVISVGSKGRERRIVNVASGYLDTDVANVGQLKSLEERVNLLSFNGGASHTPYFGVDQTSQHSEAKRITDGQKATQNYERYVNIAGQYANLLNRKANGKETFNEESLKGIEKEVTELGKNNNIATTASEITKVIEELKKLEAGALSRASDAELKAKLDEWTKKINDAVKADNTDDKKARLTQLTKTEIEESNFNGNRAEGKDSIAIGFKAHTETAAEHAIAMGYNAEAKVAGAVAIGDTALVETNAGDSVALGKNSKASAKMTALDGAEISTDSSSVKFSWKGAGTSENINADKKKAVVSVGDTGKERLITNVAAGKLDATSTDAINGGQLYGVASVFATLATDVLGVDKADNGKEGFKKGSFDKLKDVNGKDTSVAKPTSFKDAIDKNIETINKGLKFADNKGGEFTRQLGAKVTIKGDGTDLTSAANGDSITFTLNKVKTLNDSTNGAEGDKVVTANAVKTYLNSKINGISTTLELEADNSKNGTGPHGTVALKTQKLKIAGTANEVTTSVQSNGQTITIGLDKKIKDDIKDSSDKIKEIKTEVTNLKSNQTLKYKANGTNGQTVKLAEGLDFKNDTNITVEVGASGAVTHKLNSTLKGITSIAKDTNGNGTKITLEDDKITVNKKITGVEDGSITAGSKDVVNGGQLHTELEKKANKQLDNIDQAGKDVISKLAADAVKAEKDQKASSALSVKAEKADNGKSTTIKVGLNESTLITNLSTGASIDKPNDGTPKLVTDKQVNTYVSSVLGGKKLTFADKNGGTHESKLDSTFKLIGNEDITVTVGNGDAKDEGKATFTLNKATTIPNTDNHADKDKVATAGAVKTYVDNALKTSKDNADKTAVKYDDENKTSLTLGGAGSGKPPVEIKNLKSGLGLDDNGTANLDANTAKAKVDSLLKNTDKDALHKAVNAGDLKAIALSGLDFAGNSGEVHRNLGEKLNIKGAGIIAQDFKGADGNINVKAENDTLTVELANKLKNLESAEFISDSVRGGNVKQKVKTTIDGTGTAIKEIEDSGVNKRNGKTAEYKLDKVLLKDGDKLVAMDTEHGTTVKYGNEQVTTTADGISIRNGENEDKEVLSIKNKNGKGEINFAKGADGKITGLADLTDTSDDSSATNKKYVDNALKTLKDNADKTAVKYDDDTKSSITLGGKDSGKAPVAITNLKSGLGIDDIQGQPDSAKQGKMVELVKDLVAGKFDTNTHKAVNVGDLKAIALSGLNFVGNDGKDVHKNLGEKLEIVGRGVKDINNFKGTDNNIAVTNKDSKLEISLNESLKDMDSFETKAKQVRNDPELYAKSKLDGAGLHLKPYADDTGLLPLTDKEADYGLLSLKLRDGDKTNTQTADDITLKNGDSENVSTAIANTLEAKDGNDPTVTLINKQTAAGNTMSDDKGNIAVYSRTGATLSNKKGDDATYKADRVTLLDIDGNTATLNSKGLTVGDSDSKSGDKTNTTYAKNGLTVHGKDGKEAVSLTTTHKDGKDTATLAFAKDGDKATGVITGLKDLDDKADGSSAANKNYVDSKLEKALSDAAGNRPFDYYLDDVKVSKDKDGKFYKEQDGEKVELNDDEKAKVVIKAEPTATPMVVSNIKDGKLSTDSKDAVNGSQLVKATGAMLDKDDNMTFADGRDGKAASDADAAANKGLTAQDGLNGKNANDKANALRNGEAGTLVYTDEAGNRLVKANDGKYYKATDIEANGMPKANKSAVENPQLSLVNAEGKTDVPTVLGNAASGLGVSTPTENQKTKLAELAKAIDDKVGVVGEKAKALSDKAQTFTDLTLAVSSLEQAIDAMPDGEAKEKAQATLQANKEKLAQAKTDLETARNELKTAKAELTKANSDYDNGYNDATKATDKVADLVKADSSAKLSNVATVGDLQAVAKAGLNFTGNDDVKVHKNIGESVSIKGEGEFNSEATAKGNIKVEASQDGQGLEVKLSDRLQNMTSFETREVDGKKAVLNSYGLQATSAEAQTNISAMGVAIKGKGNNAGKSANYQLDGVKLQDKDNTATMSANNITLADKAGKASSSLDKNGLTVKGEGGEIAINGARGEITLPDVKPDASGSVAVNKNYVDAKNNELQEKLNSSSKELRAGIAGALAAAGLPNSSMPGKSMIAASASSYKGHSAVALGYSRVSDNGKVIIRLQGTSNSAGDYGGSVGVGYQW
ncbi:YadA-like family protein [Seminibacterium arietis]|uniref:YadA-like family protein n=1 Tax=Seminibacterium arietis TaxID=1173502 RepID=A0ABW3I6P8_9PAST